MGGLWKASPAPQPHPAGLSEASSHRGGGRCPCYLCHPCSPSVKACTVQWQLVVVEAPSQEENVLPDPAILPEGTVVTHRQCKILRCG